MKRKEHIEFLVVDIISIIISFSLSYLIYFKKLDYLFVDIYRNTLLVIFIPNIFMVLIRDFYKDVLIRDNGTEIMKNIELCFVNFMFIVLYFYVFKLGYLFSRVTLVLFYILYFFISLLIKVIYKRIVIKNNNEYKRLMLVCLKSQAKDIIDTIDANEYIKHKLICIDIVDKNMIGETINNYPVVSYKNELVEECLKNKINDVYIALKPSKIKQEDIKELLDKDINVHLDINNIYDVEAELYDNDEVSIYKTIRLGSFEFSREQELYFKFKRLFDIIISSILLIPTSILLVLVKLIYIINGDDESIFYKQVRIGKDGKIFNLYKIRTMVANADEVLEELLKKEYYKKQWDNDHKLENDPRITSYGDILRKTSIDELPQLINVLKGDMSLIGPRPLVKDELESHGGLKLYHKINPGISGWWACNGRSNINYSERLELEYYYIRHVSFRLDAVCFFRTIFAIIKKTGAK